MTLVTKYLSDEQIISIAKRRIKKFEGSRLGILVIKPARSEEEKENIRKQLIQLSSFVSIYFQQKITDSLKKMRRLPKGASWIERKAQEFPDIVMMRRGRFRVGFEIKTCYMGSSEITANMRVTQKYLRKKKISVVVLAWDLSSVSSGTPKIKGIWIERALKVARYRDNTYNKPPENIVREPEDTSHRTKNLKQISCKGLKLQKPRRKSKKLQKVIEDCKRRFRKRRSYSLDKEYQRELNWLKNTGFYREDANFGRLDRIKLKYLNEFKRKFLSRYAE